MLFWEDDYQMVEIMSIDNLHFAKSAIRENQNNDTIEHEQIQTQELGILKTELSSLLESVNLVKYERISYAGIGEPRILENPKTTAYGSNSTAIFFDGDEDIVEHIWLSSHNWKEVNDTKIADGLKALGDHYNMILVDTYPIQNKIVNLKDMAAIHEYLDRYVERFNE